MYSANFFERVDLIKSALIEQIVVGAGAPSSRETALGNIIRSGFCVTLFSSLEKYINDTARRALSELNTSLLPYSNFPSALKNILVLEVLSGISNQIRLAGDNWDITQKIQYAELEVKKLSNFNSNPRQYSGIGFNSKGSNLYDADISTFLKSIAKDANWGYLGSILASIGGSRIDLKTDFITLSKDRHKSAHQAEAQIDISKINLHIDASTAIAISFTIASEYLLHLIKTRNSFVDINNQRGNYMTHIRFIKNLPNGKIARMSSNGSIIKYYSDMRTAVDETLNIRNVMFAIVQNNRGLPLDIFIKGRIY